MEPLAAAKMKATTTVTLFIIIFLIAAWWSTVDVNAAEAAERAFVGDLAAFRDPSWLGRPSFFWLERLWLERRLSISRQIATLDYWRYELELARQEGQGQADDAERLERLEKRLEWRLEKRLEWLEMEMKMEKIEKIEKIEKKIEKIENKIEKIEIGLVVLGLEMVVLGQKKKKKKMGQMGQSLSYEPRHHMGNIWITVGFSIIFFFFMALTLRVFRDLEKRRKSCRKTHAFPFDDLGGVTNLLG